MCVKVWVTFFDQTLLWLSTQRESTCCPSVSTYFPLSFLCNILPSASFIASAQCPHSWAHMVSSSCQVSIGAGAQIAWRWPPTQASCQLWTQRQQEGAAEGGGFCRLYSAESASITDQKYRKHMGMKHEKWIYTWMVIAKWVSDCRIGTIWLTLRFKFDILETVEILMEAVKLQISKAFSLPSLFKLAKFPSSPLNFPLPSNIFCLLYILFSGGRPWTGDRESFTWLFLLLYKAEQREDRLSPRWTVCNVVSYS